MRAFDYNELVEKINGIEIVLQGDEVVTFYNDKEKARKSVSTKYEIFDFKPFVISSIDEILKSYEIEKYTLSLVGGRQEIRLFSYPEVINGESFTRAFYLLNSSDKSRALSFSYGLRHNNFHYISTKGSVYKKHFTGITKFVEERIDLDDTIFQEQLEVMEKVIGDTILMSNVQKIITDSEILKDSKVSLKNNFDTFRNHLYLATAGSNLDESDRRKLKVSYVNRNRTNVDFTEDKNNFTVDSFLVFKTYLKMFGRRDASVIKRESERISGLSVLTNRNNVLDSLLEEIGL
mgnify:CR=1 FL=1|tara:strand:- start:39136 stop:40008 length:873 start_codon:yes stop_codon:yes gene_type:complete